jgi:hypothetical protein
MTGAPGDADDVEAQRTDRYLDAVLGDGDADRRAAAADPRVAAAAGALQRDLVRVHPSFRFEERLARTLADVAAAMRLPAAAGAEGAGVAVVAFPGERADPSTIDPAADELDAELEPAGALPRPVLIGGAVASAALSIAGAAIVAWRLGRGSAGRVDVRRLILPDVER